MSLFVTFEGGEAAGKSTQIRLLRQHLVTKGVDCITTREPGGSPGAEEIRKLLLDPRLPLAPESELLLVFAARFDHLAATVLPALDTGRVVLCDRFVDSTFAYQGYGPQAPVATFDFMRSLDARLPRHPDLTVLLDVSPDVATSRLKQRGGMADRFEQRDDAFHARVRAGFRDLAGRHPERCILINADASADAVHRRIVAAWDERLGAGAA